MSRSDARALVTPEVTGMTVEDLRVSAEQLHAVLEAIDSGTLEVSGRQRAYIAGAVRVLELAPAAVEHWPAV